ncbi:hypothetical protein [Paenibacillus agricola]|uniref:Spore germination protein PE n=1 Tax=Paenibacillus agricola TaxID=2716264 RepID=A0ABX0J9G9_9BACL|nr:hypothetical protein [Paenibacillus agricola]NHN31951.1 hypothetical protein [Paenibacillus agricola]
MSLKIISTNLLHRLAVHLQSEVAIQAEGFASEPGLLQHVGKRFIKVSEQYFVPSTLQEIVLLGTSINVSTVPIQLRTIYMGGFPALLVRTGSDYIEVIVSRVDEEEELRVLIPLGQVISIEKTNES